MTRRIPGSSSEFFGVAFGKTAVVMALLFAACRSLCAEPQAGLTEPPAEGPVRWSSFLPLMADDAIKHGYDLPLPFGVSPIYNYVERQIKVNDLSIGLNGAPQQSVSKFVNLGSKSQVNAAIGRVDAWLLPFMDVYGLFGYIHNESTTHGIVTIPLPPPLPGSRSFEFSGKTTLDGFVGGAGITLAGGYENFFLTADANYSQTDIGFDDSFRALIVSFRTGWNGKIARTPTRFWVGAMYWDTENTAKSTVKVPGQGTVSFAADQGPAHPWNASVGASVAFSKRWECVAEYGFNLDDVHIIIAGLTFRF